MVDVAIVDYRVVFIPDWSSSDSTLAQAKLPRVAGAV
jgi:hypothetical protein